MSCGNVPVQRAVDSYAARRANLPTYGTLQYVRVVVVLTGSTLESGKQLRRVPDGPRSAMRRCTRMGSTSLVRSDKGSAALAAAKSRSAKSLHAPRELVTLVPMCCVIVTYSLISMHHVAIAKHHIKSRGTAHWV